MKSNSIEHYERRAKHGSYRSVYLDTHGNGRKEWRAEYQSVDAAGVVRLRRWFVRYEDARKWVHGL